MARTIKEIDVKMIKEFVDIEKIDINDNYFNLSFNPLLNLEILESSIKSIGIINPVKLRDNKIKYQIIDGFKRINLAKKLGIEKIFAYIYDKEELDDFEGFKLTFYENITVRDFNLIEKAHIIKNLIERFNLNEDIVAKRYLPLLKLEPHRRIIKSYIALNKLDNEVKEYIIINELPLSVASLFLNFLYEEQREIIKFFSKIKLNTNLTKEFLIFLDEVSLKEEKKVKEIIEGIEIKSILENEEYSPSEKTLFIRKILKRKRYPLLTKIEEDFLINQKRLKLLPKMKIVPPPFFEGDSLKIECEFKSTKELKEIGQKILELTNLQEMKNLILDFRGED